VSFRFVHAADLHLDTPFQGIGQVNPAVQAALRDASLDAFDRLIDLCIDEEAAFLLLAGDLYDGADRGVRAQLRVRAGLERLSALGIQTFIIHGNHDPMNGWSAIRAWPPGVHIFSSTDVEQREAIQDGVTLATIYGMSYPKRDVTENLALRYRRDPLAQGIQIGLLHGTVGAVTEHDAYSPCELNDLRAVGLDYWALGHIHTRRILNQGQPWVVYPGNLQGRSLKPSEQGPKGAYVVEVDGQIVTAPRFVALDNIRFLAVDLAITDLIDLAAVRTALNERVESLRVENAGRGLLLRAHLSGRGSVHPDLQRIGALSGLLRELQGDAQGHEPFVWWTAIRDDSKSDLVREAIRLRGDFAAELIAVSDTAVTDDALRRKLQACLETPTFLRSVLAGAPPEKFDWDALIADADAVALDLLETGSAR